MLNKLLKCVLCLLLVGVLLICNIRSVYAVRVTWSEITNAFKKAFPQVEGTITATSNALSIRGNDSSPNYSLDFSYENDVITLVPRSKEGISDAEISDFTFADIVFIANLVYAISDLYGVPGDKIDNDKYPQFGMNFTTTKIDYTDPDTGLRSYGDYIDAFSMDLNIFEEKILELKAAIGDDSTPQPSSSSSSASSSSIPARSSSSSSSSNSIYNPDTGRAAIVFAWILGIGTIIVSIRYFKQINNNEI